ncbi:MAG: PH domain-containing protein [Lachnospiraceae bacterium]|nr:PH domain-containing protein [Lachnospiraceae bacterium]
MNIVWKARKRTWFGLPWTFTVYTLTEDKILVESGLFTSKQDEVRLYRIMDVSLTRNLIQKIFKMGTITCVSGDKTMPTFQIKNIKDSKNVKETLSNMVEEERNKKRVASREFMATDDADEIDVY